MQYDCSDITNIWFMNRAAELCQNRGLKPSSIAKGTNPPLSNQEQIANDLLEQFRKNPVSE